MERGRATLCKIDQLMVTPYHPIKIGDLWKFPVDLVDSGIFECDSVYTFLLDGAR